MNEERKIREEGEGLYCHGNATRDRVTWTNWRGAGEVGARPAGQRTARNTDTTLLRDCEVAVATRNRDDRASTATFPCLDACSDVVADRSRKSTKTVFSLSRPRFFHAKKRIDFVRTLDNEARFYKRPDTRALPRHRYVET